MKTKIIIYAIQVLRTNDSSQVFYKYLLLMMSCFHHKQLIKLSLARILFFPRLKIALCLEEEPAWCKLELGNA